MAQNGATVHDVNQRAEACIRVTCRCLGSDRDGTQTRWSESPWRQVVQTAGCRGLCLVPSASGTNGRRIGRGLAELATAMESCWSSRPVRQTQSCARGFPVTRRSARPKQVPPLKVTIDRTSYAPSIHAFVLVFDGALPSGDRSLSMQISVQYHRGPMVLWHRINNRHWLRGLNPRNHCASRLPRLLTQDPGYSERNAPRSSNHCRTRSTWELVRLVRRTAAMGIRWQRRCNRRVTARPQSGNRSRGTLGRLCQVPGRPHGVHTRRADLSRLRRIRKIHWTPCGRELQDVQRVGNILRCAAGST